MPTLKLVKSLTFHTPKARRVATLVSPPSPPAPSASSIWPVTLSALTLAPRRLLPWKYIWVAASSPVP